MPPALESNYGPWSSSPRSGGPQSRAFYLPSPIFQLLFRACTASHRFCGPIHSEGTNLFQIMKIPAAIKTLLSLLPPVQSVRRFALCFRHAAPTIFTNLSVCADRHSFCEAIHSEDTNL